MRKSELRQTYLTKQKAISRPDRSAKSEAISDAFFESFDLVGVKYLHSFLPIEKFNEVDSRRIVEKVWSKYPNIQIVVPRVDFETSEITSLKFTAETGLVKNVWEIDEPTHDEFVAPEMIDMVLVPGLCFDLDGHRVGYGKGFYDRFLKTCRLDCVKIGLSYFEPVDKIDDAHDGDVQLDFVITPGRVQRG
ncbi:MAG: 5-formyltetrahydrofolate cyclo-ligase [Acidobacteriota bacterium]